MIFFSEALEFGNFKTFQNISKGLYGGEKLDLHSLVVASDSESYVSQTKPNRHCSISSGADQVMEVVGLVHQARYRPGFGVRV